MPRKRHLLNEVYEAHRVVMVMRENVKESEAILDFRKKALELAELRRNKL